MRRYSKKQLKEAKPDPRLSPDHKMPEAFKIDCTGKQACKGVAYKTRG